MEGARVDTRNDVFENHGPGIQNSAPGGTVNSNSGNGFSFNSNHFHQAVTFNQSDPQPGPSKLGACLRSLSFGEIHHRFHDVKRAATGTCYWIFEHERFKAWASRDRGLLWIKGKPGSGKSYLMRYILDHIETNLALPSDTLILQFFFHGRGTELQKTPLGLFRSLLHQLRGIPGALDDLVASYEQKHETQGEPGQHWDWHPSELEAHLESSIDKALRTRPIWLFIDAVDESGHDHADGLVQMLTDLFESLQGKDLNPFHICFTCRHSPVLDLNPTFEICAERENRHDISMFVKQRLSGIESPSASVSAIEDLVTARANGVFLWAALTSDTVRRQARQGLTKTVIESNVDSVPQQLDDIYRGLIDDMDAESLKLIQWTCFARKPLTLLELKWAMAVEADCPHSSVQECGSVAEFPSDKENGKRRVHWLSRNLAELNSFGQVQFIHQSVRDFFIRKGLAALQDILASRNMLDTWSKANGNDSAVGIAHHRLLRICVSCILKGGTGDRPPASAESLERYYHSVNSPLLSYAVLSFEPHLKLCESERAAITDTLDLLFKDWYAFRTCWSYLYRKWSTGSARAKILSLKETLQNLNMPNSVRYVTTKRYQSPVMAARDLELIGAAKSGDVATVKELLHMGYTHETKDADGNTLLNSALVNSHDDLVRLLLVQYGAEVESRAENETALFSALRVDRQHTIGLLLSHGADIEATNDSGRTPLLYATNYHSHGMTSFLIDHGADIDARDTNGRTPLHNAVADILINNDTVCLLLSHGADVETKDSTGTTPLHQVLNRDVLAVNTPDLFRRYGGGLKRREVSVVDIIRLLVRHGADVKARDNDDQTPLHKAVTRCNFETVNFLLNNGADMLEARNDFGRTPLHEAVKSDSPNFDVIRIMLDRGANLEARDALGQTPLHLAMRRELYLAEVIDQLIRYGADLEAKDNFGQTPYDLAVQLGNADEVGYMLKPKGR